MKCVDCLRELATCGTRCVECRDQALRRVSIDPRVGILTTGGHTNFNAFGRASRWRSDQIIRQTTMHRERGIT